MGRVSIRTRDPKDDGYAFIYESGDPVVALAGVLAGRRAARGLSVCSALEGQGCDLDDAQWSCVACNGLAWRRAFTEARREARRLVRRHWLEVRALASQLLREGTVYEPILPALA